MKCKGLLKRQRTDAERPKLEINGLPAKVCYACKDLKVTTEFNKCTSSHARDGLAGECRSCKSIKDAEFRAKNSVRLTEKSRERYRQKIGPMATALTASRRAEKKKFLALKLPKNCKICGELKPLEEFRKSNRHADGRMSECIECDRKRNAEYRSENMDRLNALCLEYYYRTQKSPRHKIARSLRARLRQVFEETGSKHHINELVGCSRDYLVHHIESQFKPGMTWDNHGVYGWHIDHRVPVSYFDMTKDEDAKVCFFWMNLQPLWAKDNYSKKDHFDMETDGDFLKTLRTAALSKSTENN